MKRGLIFTAGIVSILALAGCSDSGNTAAPASSVPSGPPAATSKAADAPASPEATAWANDFCGAMLTFTKQPDVPKEEVKPGDFPALRKFFDAQASALESYFSGAIDALNKVPKAPVAVGDQAKQNMINSFQPVLDQTKAAHAKLDAAPINDAQAIQTFGAELQQVIASLNNLPDPTQGLEEAPELKNANEQAPNCKTFEEIIKKDKGKEGA